MEAVQTVSLMLLFSQEKLWTSAPGRLIVGKPARLTCSLKLFSLNCSASNLKLNWAQDAGSPPILSDAKPTQKIRKNFMGSWTVSSTFTLTPSLDHHEKTLTCEFIGADGWRIAQEAVRLEVQEKTTIVSGPTCTSFKNGVVCTCSVRANPPANITWNLSGRNITGNSSEVGVHSWTVDGGLVNSSLVLIHPTGSEKLISCITENEHGVSVSKYWLHIPEKPTIVSGPTCTSFKNGVVCTCSVRANPPANITWNLSGRNITGNSSEVGLNSWMVDGGLVNSSLVLFHPTGSEKLISCITENEHGVSVSEHWLHLPGTFPWMIVILVGAAAAVIILITVKVQRKKTSHITCVPTANADSATYAVVQHPLDAQSYGPGSNADVRETTSKSAASEEILYAALSFSNFHKPGIHLQIQESSEYAAVNCK
ncbi:sialic acid-binding Ig-like lectin 5 isoform X2 [Carcharodon carcharias]|uniref:sialic acid-binding Ig-like lectin 5 isoform X2 n=1 Tax=Carcharodon carcharias TaxID=13397 RepID=UPI001B7EA39B|nr:sialic acid-binding Ig-like lectin 5 isoform X2 [Carcharodon carcharias]